MLATLNDNAHDLYDLISDTYEVPPDNRTHYQWIRPLELPRGSETAATFSNSIVDKSFLHRSKEGNDPGDVQKLRKHWEIILLNLVYVMYQRHWLLVPTSPDFYDEDNYWTSRMDISYRPMKAVVDFLKAGDFVEWREGKTYGQQPATTRITPRPSLMWLLWQYFLDLEQPIEPPYLIVNSSDHRWEEITNLPKNHLEMQELTKINEFLKEQQWACKAPLQLQYENHSLKNGRLCTPFQNLPNTKVRLRINTLINSKPICQINFSANDLRLNLAFNRSTDPGDTPYEDIGEAAGISERQKVEDFFMIAMGSSDEKETRRLCHVKEINNHQFDALVSASKRIYPKLELFNRWDICAQQLEGKILKQVMLECVQKEICALPVKNAMAVQKEHLVWVKETMLECWDKHMGTNRWARVKIDSP